MGDPGTGSSGATSAPGPAEPAEDSRELRYLRRDVERLSLRLRQEQSRTSDAAGKIEELRAERDRVVAELEELDAARREDTAALEEATRLRDLEHERTTGELAAAAKELRWARIVSLASLVALLFVVLWTLL